MFCKKCGVENEDNAKICKKCGAQLEAGEYNTTNTSANASESHGGESPSEKMISQIKATPKKLLFCGCAAIVVLVVIIAMALNAGKTIDLNKYLTIDASGYNGYGSANTSIDWDGIEKKYGSKLSFTSAAKNEYGGLLSLITPMDAIQECVSLELDGNSNLSNGDTITYTWNVDDDLSKAINCKVKYKDGEYNVSGLSEVSSFDAFADLSVEFSGTAPSGSVEINYNGNGLSSSDFKCDKTRGLRNGDTIEVTLSNADMAYYARKLGNIPESISKTYTVNGLPEYVTAYSDMTDDFLSNLKKEAEDTIYAYTASSYAKTSALSNLEYAGYILNSIKDGGSGNISSYNNFYIIYKGDVASSDGSFSTSKVYFPVRFTNILKAADGSLSYDDNRGIVGSSRLDNNIWYSTDGYINPLTCYMEIVESNRDEYTTECGDGFEVYSENESIEKLDDISDAYKQTLYADAKDKIESYVAKDLHNGSTMENLTFTGEYLLIAKSQGNDFKTNNKYYVVYSATISHPKNDFDATIVYFPVEYDGIVKLPDGEYMVTVSNGIFGSSNLPNSFYSTDGYIDSTEMYSEIITSNRDDYKYEASEGLKEFGS